jgi:hypothetical protein
VDAKSTCREPEAPLGDPCQRQAGATQPDVCPVFQAPAVSPMMSADQGTWTTDERDGKVKSGDAQPPLPRDDRSRALHHCPAGLPSGKRLMGTTRKAKPLKGSIG